MSELERVASVKNQMEERLGGLIDIILVLYNSADCIGECLASLGASVTCPVKIWLVENLPGDGSVEAALLVRPDAHVLRPGENLGFGAACNLALGCGKAPYALMLNPDARLEPGCLDRLIEALDSDPQAGASGALVMRSDDGTIDTAGMEMVVTGWARDRGRGLLVAMAPTAGEVDALSGGVLLLRRSALRAIRRLPEAFWGDFFLYNEDVELSMSLRRGGWRLLFVPEARAIHAVGGSGGARRLMRGYCARNRVVAMLTHASRKDLVSPRFHLQWIRRIVLDIPQLTDNLRLKPLRRSLWPLLKQIPGKRRQVGR